VVSVPPGVTTPFRVAAVADTPLAGTVIPGAHCGDWLSAFAARPFRIQLTVGVTTGSNSTAKTFG
jgi:hypothetical protein